MNELNQVKETPSLRAAYAAWIVYINTVKDEKGTCENAYLCGFMDGAIHALKNYCQTNDSADIEIRLPKIEEST